MNRSVLFTALVVFTAAVYLGCSNNTVAPGAPTYLVVSPDTVALSRFDSVHLNVAVLTRDSSLLPGAAVQFESSDTAVVTVTRTGEVHAVGPLDTATVIVRSPPLTKKIPVFVTSPPAGILVSPADTTIRQGGSYQLRAVVVDQFADTLPQQPITFESSNLAMITVSPSGLVHSVGNAGQAFITLRSNGLQTQASLRVLDTSIVAQLQFPGAAPAGAGISKSGVVYVTLAGSQQLKKLDVPSHTVTGTVAVGVVPTRVIFDTAGTTAYVSNQLSQSVGVVDVASNAETGLIQVTGNPVPMRVSANGQWLYVATDANRLYKISRATNLPVDSVPLPATAHFELLNPNDTLLYVATRDGGTVMEVNVWTWTVLRTFVIGGRTQAMVLAPNGSELYVANETLNRVHVVNLTSGAVTDSIPLQGGGFGLGLSADGKDLWVTESGSGAVQVLDRTARTVLRTIIVSGTPREVVFHAASGLAVVPNEAGWVDFLH
jgi:YVTN family beta-propeller protein